MGCFIWIEVQHLPQFYLKHGVIGPLKGTRGMGLELCCRPASLQLGPRNFRGLCHQAQDPAG